MLSAIGVNGALHFANDSGGTEVLLGNFAKHTVELIANRLDCVWHNVLFVEVKTLNKLEHYAMFVK